MSDSERVINGTIGNRTKIEKSIQGGYLVFVWLPADNNDRLLGNRRAGWYCDAHLGTLEGALRFCRDELSSVPEQAQESD